MLARRRERALSCAVRDHYGGDALAPRLAAALNHMMVAGERLYAHGDALRRHQPQEKRDANTGERTPEQGRTPTETKHEKATDVLSISLHRQRAEDCDAASAGISSQLIAE